MGKKVFLDTNILIDYLASRRDYVAASTIVTILPSVRVPMPSSRATAAISMPHRLRSMSRNNSLICLRKNK